MEQSQLVEMIQTLDPKERKQILQFASVQFFNPTRMRPYVGPLIELCMNHPWNEQDKVLRKVSVYATIFPGEEFIEGKLEKVMVEAQKFLRSYLLTRHYFRDDNEFYQTLDFAEISRIRGLKGKYKQSMDRLNEIQQNQTAKNASYFLKQLHLEGAIHYVESINNQQKNDINIGNVLHATEIFYHIRRVSLLSRYLLQMQVAKLDVPEFIELHIEENHVPERCLLESPQLNINFEIFKVLRNGLPGISDIRTLIDLLQVNEKSLDDETLQEFYTYLRNFAILISRVNRENVDIHFMLHELFLDNLRRGYLHYEGKLTPNRYVGIVENALIIKEFDWALEFIEANKDRLHGENENHDIYHFTKARYLFGIGQYDECLKLLPDSSNYVDFLLLGRRLEIKVYFELGSDLLNYKLEAFKMYLSRTSKKILPDTYRQAHVEFTNFLTQIISSIPGDAERAERVIKRIEANKQVVEWRWLLEKANALKKRHS